MVNTKHILFIMSGAFQELPDIISNRMNAQQIGFGGNVGKGRDESEWLKHVQSEDLVAYGFESEFVGRLPVRAVFDRLGVGDLFDILKNPSNPIVLGKKLDFAAYGIGIKFDDALLKQLAHAAHKENTGARGLVSAVENALLPFEKKLPSINANVFPATERVVSDPKGLLSSFVTNPTDESRGHAYKALAEIEKQYIAGYLNEHWERWSDQYHFTLTAARADAIAEYYIRGVMDIGMAIGAVKTFYEKIKALELRFFKNHEINIVLEEETIDYLMEQLVDGHLGVENIYQQLTDDFEHGLKLILEKTGKNRFFISKKALLAPEAYLNELIRDELREIP
jgi:hypothetical protein